MIQFLNELVERATYGISRKLRWLGFPAAFSNRRELTSPRAWLEPAVPGKVQGAMDLAFGPFFFNI